MIFGNYAINYLIKNTAKVLGSNTSHILFIFFEISGMNYVNKGERNRANYIQRLWS